MIYVLEDDNSIREFVVYTLCHMDLEARGFERPSEFWNGMEQELPSLILLDIMLPEEDGLSVLISCPDQSIASPDRKPCRYFGRWREAHGWFDLSGYETAHRLS